jgi:adenylate cyclase
MTQGRARSFEDAGLYEPAAPDASDRLALLEHLSERDVAIEEMVAAQSVFPHLATLAADRILMDAGTLVSAQQIAAQTGVAIDRVLRVRLASGLPAEAEQLLPAWVVNDVNGFEAASVLFGEAATLAFTRVMGSSADRIAEAAVGLFLSEVDAELNARGASGVEWATANEEAASLVGVVTTTMTHLFREHLMLAVRRQRVASSSDAGTGNVRSMAIGFVDLANSTQWASTLALRDQARALALFEKSAWEIATKRGGRVVKLIGDEAMFAVADAPDACQIALDLCEAVSKEPSLPAARGAVGFGEVVTRDGDYFGPLVHIVSRSVKVAGESEVVVDESVMNHTRSAGVKIRFTAIGPQAFRGVEAAVSLFLAEVDRY